VATISPASQLPTITEAVTIDGYSQPGAKSNTLAVGNDAVLKVELSGPGSGSGLRIGAAYSTVKGLVINRWGEGIHISESGATGNKVVGNYVGTDSSGTKDLGSHHGVHIIEAPNNAVGGAAAAERNVISGNDAYGVAIDGANAGGNRVTGNYVGTDASGTKDLGNSLDGVHIALAPNNAVGGTTAGAGNVISGNGRDGVGIVMAEDTGNRVLSNSIFSNDGLDIDLLGGTENAAGTTANDPKDPDTGPNKLQNFPVVTSVAKNAIKGTLNSKPGTSYTVQLFSNPSGEDEGKTLVGQRSVTTDGSGNASFSVKPSSEVAPGQSVTATATDPEGNTSEFSAPKTR
jgi:hypothetical protein